MFSDGAQYINWRSIAYVFIENWRTYKVNFKTIWRKTIIPVYFWLVKISNKYKFIPSFITQFNYKICCCVTVYYIYLFILLSIFLYDMRFF